MATGLGAYGNVERSDDNPQQPPNPALERTDRYGHGGRQADLGCPSRNLECHTEASGPQGGEIGRAMMRYMVVVERGETSWGAHAPDLSGCVAVGEAREEVLLLIREAPNFTARA